MKHIGIITGSKVVDANVIQSYLNKDYNVKVATTDISNTSNYEHLMTLPNADHLHISELDLKKPKAILDFIKDCDYLLLSSSIITDILNT